MPLRHFAASFKAIPNLSSGIKLPAPILTDPASLQVVCEFHGSDLLDQSDHQHSTVQTRS